MRCALILTLTSLAACQPDAGLSPAMEAHRGGAGLAPQNSRSAIVASMELGVEVVEFDLVLTSDGIPVVAHDPWLDDAHCARQDGSPIGDRVYLQDLSLQQALGDYLCGGIPDPDFPDAAVVAEPLMTLDELLAAAAGHPDVGLHLDVKVEPGMTADGDAFAEAILSRVQQASLENPWYMSANLSEVIQAFEGWGEGEGMEVRSSLIWPRFPPDSSSTAVALQTELGVGLGLLDMIGHAERAGADGVALPWQLADRRRIVDARAAGLQVQLWTLNTSDLLDTYSRWPVDALITDYPLGAP
ncbi:MAG: hypothetical protein JXX28_06930 [Deltaproteobacteria bacterium]|nr:hypothetical protein [Deltaproteobacteria bacterium]